MKEIEMFQPNGLRDMIGAVLLVLVALLYLAGVTEMQGERAAELEEAEAVVTVSAPATPPLFLDLSC